LSTFTLCLAKSKGREKERKRGGKTKGIKERKMKEIFISSV
jgi:hypothetical protein